MATAKKLQQFEVVFPARIRFAISCAQDLAWHILSSEKYQTNPARVRGNGFEVHSIGETYRRANPIEDIEEATKITIRIEGGFTIRLFISATLIANSYQYSCDRADVSYYPLGSYSRTNVKKSSVIFTYEELWRMFRPQDFE